MPKDSTKTTKPDLEGLERLCERLNDPRISKIQVIRNLCHEYSPDVNTFIRNFLIKWLAEAKGNNKLYEERISLIAQYGNTNLLKRYFAEKIASWIFSAPSQQIFAHRTALAIRPRSTFTNQELTKKIIDWIEEGIRYGETESNCRALWVLQSPYAAYTVTATLESGKFEVMDALVNCRDSDSFTLFVPFAPFCTWLYMAGTNHHKQVSLILNSDHQKAISAMLIYLVGWVFDEKQNFSEQCLRLQLILSSNCKPAINEIARYIAGWIIGLPYHEQIYGVELILNSMPLEVIHTISPYLKDILNKLSMVHHSKCQATFMVPAATSCASPTSLFGSRTPRYDEESPSISTSAHP